MQKDIFSDNEDITFQDKDIFSSNDISVEKKSLGPKGKIIITVVVLIIMAGMMVGGYFIGVNSGIGADLPMMIEAYRYMKKYYYKDITWSEFQVYATSGFAGSLDSFTGLAYFSDSGDGTSSAGLQFTKDEYNRLFIDFIYPESNAYTTAAGFYKKEFTQGYIRSYIDADGKEVYATILNDAKYLEQGDRVYAINGTRVENANNETYSKAITTLVNGSSDTIYLDVVKRDADGNDLDGYYCYAIEKSVYSTKQAYYTSSAELGTDGVGMIRLMSFESTAAVDFADCVAKFNNDEKKPNKLILDLRGNGGGDSQICGYIAQYLLKNPSNENLQLAKYVYNDGKTKDAVQWFTTVNSIDSATPTAVSLNNTVEDFEVTVLCDKSSASCSELLIGALQYYNGAQIVGSKTYGKGVAQQVFRLSNTEYRLYVTNGFYYLPTAGESGVQWNLNIHNVGITPSAENITQTRRDRYTKDEAIKRAVEILNS